MKSAIVILASVLAVSSVFATEVAKAPTKAPVVATAPATIKLALKKVVKKVTPAKSAKPAVKVPAAAASSTK